MMVIEETQVPDAALPVAELSRHLRLGRGFGTDGMQDAVLCSFLRAAQSAVEARTGKILLSRTVRIGTEAWDTDTRHPLPLAPVDGVISVTLVDGDGVETLADPATYRLRQDMADPALVAVRACLPAIPPGGRADIRLVAGYGTSFTQVPADLGQAVLLLAAHYYEYRDETALSEGCMPFGVTSLLTRYRTLRVGFTR